VTFGVTCFKVGQHLLGGTGKSHTSSGRRANRGGSEIRTCVLANYEGEVLSTVPRASNIQVNTICVHFFIPYVSVNSCLVFINMI